MAFTVVVYNVQYGQVWDPDRPDDAPIRFADCVRDLAEQKADLLLIQEVEQAGPRGRQPQPPRNLEALQAAFPGWHTYFEYPPHDERELPFGIGLAILSRAPLTERVSRPLPAADLSFEFRGETTGPTERLVLGATTVLDGHPVRVFNTHLQAYFMIGASSDDHPEQRQVVASLVRGSTLPTLVGGDFNIAPGEHLLSEFAAAGYQPVQTEKVTWKRRPYVTDHILHNRGLRCLEAEVVPTRSSDHDLLRARLEVR